MINPLITEPFESEILELIETRDDYTTVTCKALLPYW